MYICMYIREARSEHKWSFEMHINTHNARCELASSPLAIRDKLPKKVYKCSAGRMQTLQQGLDHTCISIN